MSEEWKQLPEYYGNIFVSSIGNLKRRDHKPMKSWKTPNGYLRAMYSYKGRRKQFPVHVLVARAFIGKCPKGKEVNHIDRDRLNNNIDNLEYVTRQENVIHSCGSYNGKRYSNIQLARDLKIKYNSNIAVATIEQRLIAGWPEDKAAILPLHTRIRNAS